MFENGKDEPSAMRDDGFKPKGDEVPVDNADDLEMPPSGVKELPPFLQRALEKAIQHATVDSVERDESKHRDQFAAVAMGSIVRCDMQRGQGFEPANIAQRAYDVAEAMLTERAVRESFGHRRSAEVVTVLTEGRAVMKAQLNEAEVTHGVAEGIKVAAEKAKARGEGFIRGEDEPSIKFSRFNQDFLRRVRELVEAGTSPGLTTAIIATDLGCSQLEADHLLAEVRAERQE